MFLQRCGTHHMSELFDVANVTCRKHFLYTEILQLVGALSCSAPTECFTISCRWFLCELMFENERTFWS
jgi:hypothetical protein